MFGNVCTQNELIPQFICPKCKEHTAHVYEVIFSSQARIRSVRFYCSTHRRNFYYKIETPTIYDEIKKLIEDVFHKYGYKGKKYKIVYRKDNRPYFVIEMTIKGKYKSIILDVSDELLKKVKKEIEDFIIESNVHYNFVDAMKKIYKLSEYSKKFKVEAKKDVVIKEDKTEDNKKVNCVEVSEYKLPKYELLNKIRNYIKKEILSDVNLSFVDVNLDEGYFIVRISKEPRAFKNVEDYKKFLNDLIQLKSIISKLYELIKALYNIDLPPIILPDIPRESDNNLILFFGEDLFDIPLYLRLKEDIGSLQMFELFIDDLINNTEKAIDKMYKNVKINLDDLPDDIANIINNILKS